MGLTRERVIGNLAPGFALLAAMLGARASAQPMLLQGTPAGLQETISVSTYAGSVPATAAPVEVSRQILVLILSDMITPGQKDRVRTELQSFIQSGNLKDVTLGTLRGQEFALERPFRTRVQLQAALRRVFAGPPSEQPRYPAAGCYRWLAHAAAQFGSNWSSVVLIGSAPEVDAPLREYATSYVASRFQAPKVRLNYWNPDGPNPEWFGEICRATGGAALANGLRDSHTLYQD